jgi:SAM-dependent methyltransferase
VTRCRTCKSERLYLFLPLGAHPLANGFLTEEQLSRPEPTFPLDAHVCLDCGLIQVADNVPPEYFRHYVYVPSTSDAVREHFAALADVLAERFLGGPEALAVDIGCNDGLLLGYLRDRGVATLGVDPATNIIEMARDKGLQIVNEYFSPEIARRIRAERGPAAVIVTTNTFHHVDDLDSFTEGVTMLLDDDGVFVIEVPHALELVEQNEFDGIYHEHVSQHTVKSFVDLFRRFGLEVFGLERLAIHGGSVRVLARRATNGAISNEVRRWLDEERERGLFDRSTYDAFRERVERNKRSLLEVLTSAKAEGRRIVGYGASARGNTLLNYYGIGVECLEYLVDRNALKHGLYSPGMHIQVRPAEAILEDQPDYVLIVAWNFADEIMRQQEEYRGRGGRFILPIPEPEVVD